MDVNVRERRLPLVGRQFEVALASGSNVVVTVENATGDRIFSVMEPGEDHPRVELRLRDTEALTLATLMSGVNVVHESDASDVPATGVHVETMTISAASPAVGKPIDELDLPDAEDATVLAVIRDDTPALVEQDEDRPCQAGDRLVIAGHAAPLRELRSYLVG